MKLLVTAPLVSLILLFPGQAVKADGKSIYAQTCAACHATGLGGAPKLGDKKAWSARIGVGRDAIMQSALKGKGGMPPKGGNPALSDKEVISAVEYILAQEEMGPNRSHQVRIESTSMDKQ
jgi:cytochrome c5